MVKNRKHASEFQECYKPLALLKKARLTTQLYFLKNHTVEEYLYNTLGEKLQINLYIGLSFYKEEKEYSKMIVVVIFG